MWIMTTGGFVSAVADTSRPGMLKVRARDRESLETMRQGIAQITDTPLNELLIVTGQGTDYPYRVYVSKEDFATWLAKEVMVCLDYENFKDALKKNRGARWATAASRIWTALLDLVTDVEGERATTSYYGTGYAYRPSPLHDYLGWNDGSIYPEIEQDVPEDAVFWEAERAALYPKFPGNEQDWFLSPENRAAIHEDKGRKGKGRGSRASRKEQRTLPTG